jgi:sulfite reductase alpha subunit-like flavoprotein
VEKACSFITSIGILASLSFCIMETVEVTSASSIPPQTRTETITIIYGSQTGNSEQYAQEFAAQIPLQLTPERIQYYTDTPDTIHVKVKLMQCDDFLEQGKPAQRCAWTRCMVVFTSSYGIGQAPLGCHRFRDLCDAWTMQYKQFPYSLPVLQGMHYVMCGLGDSKYTTYFHNPTVIDQALTRAGAKRHGPLGQADASATGEDVQVKVVHRWMEDIWKHVATIVAMDPLPSERLSYMRQETVAICRIINPDFMPAKKSSVTVPDLIKLFLLAILASLAIRYWRHHTSQS